MLLNVDECSNLKTNVEKTLSRFAINDLDIYEKFFNKVNEINLSNCKNSRMDL